MSNCEHKLTAPGYVYYTNGAQHIHLKCSDCAWILPQAQPKQGYEGVPLPTWEDNTNFDLYPECSYNGCNRPGLEEHHWAMRSLFDDADLWPMTALCQPHHSHWHRVMLNNGLTYPKKEAS